MTHGVLPPPQFDVFRVFRICPSCNRWFALHPIDAERGQNTKDHPAFRCKHCGKETTFPQPRPPRCL
jgi:hypothetical protein